MDRVGGGVGRWPIEWTYADQYHIGLHQQLATLPYFEGWSLKGVGLKIRGGPCEQAFPSIKSKRLSIQWWQVWIQIVEDPIDESIFHVERCFQIQREKPWSALDCSLNLLTRTLLRLETTWVHYKSLGIQYIPSTLLNQGSAMVSSIRACVQHFS